MIQDLEYLIKLQEVDLRIKEQENAREQFPAAAADLEARIKRAEDAAVAAAESLEKLTGGLQALDDEAAKLRVCLAKSEEVLSGIKTNQEYDAAHKQIEAQRAMLSASESRKKKLEDNIEGCLTALEETKAEAERLRTELRPQIDELTAKIGAIDSNIAEITKERDLIAPNVSAPTQRQYDAIRKKRKNGKAVALIGGDGTCSTCFMNLQPHLLNEVRRGSKILLCESCGSMLIYDETGS